MKRIYLDHAATTPVDKRVLRAMLPYFTKKYGNPMSLHSFGREAQKAVEEARIKVAGFFNCLAEEIFFTSGATESNNWVIKGVIKAHWTRNKIKPHIVTSAIEHHCILEACQSIEKEGLAGVTYLKPDAQGIISLENIRKAVKKNTILVSIMYVNNEIGTKEPIEEIGKALGGKVLFHTDATQAVSYFDCDVKKLGVDFLSMSGHKIYGPKGVGVLYLKKGSLISRIQEGGAQEGGMRAGTHNVPGIVGLAKAVELIKKDKKVLQLRNYLISRVLKEIPLSRLNGSLEKRSPNNANFTFNNIEGESLVMLLDREGIASSTGSACSSRSLEPSHVLSAIGLRPEEAHGSLRLTLGKDTTRKDIDFTVGKIKKAVAKLREISGNVLEEYEQLH
ncbi:MAG: cysteine desulfurase family protein [Candidatus Paceibacterota bacterium]|jgi:cysteine desulfurase